MVVDSIIDINNMLMKVLGVDHDKEFISKITVNITPDNYPEVVITKVIIADDKAFNITEMFELKPKEQDNGKGEG